VAVLTVVGLTTFLGWWEIQLFLDNMTTELSTFLGWWETQLFFGNLTAFLGLAYQWLIYWLSIAPISIFRLYLCTLCCWLPQGLPAAYLLSSLASMHN
jgi:hypothetical protein